MNEEIKKYIDDLFLKAPKTKAAYELKEELMANSNERFYDLLKEGVPEGDALDIVMTSIGDIDQLFPDMNSTGSLNRHSDEHLKKNAAIKAVAIALYIIGFAVWMTMDQFVGTDLGFVVMLIFAAVATGMLVYINTAYPSYKKKDDTVVENFKEWNSNKTNNKAVEKSVNTIIWMMVLVAYFIVSFATGAWHVTWILFLAGACVQAIATLLFNLNGK